MPFMKQGKRLCALMAGALSIVMLTSCASETEAVQTAERVQTAEVPAAVAEKHQKQVFAMDTVMILTAYGENAEDALDAAEERILELEADFDPSSAGGSVYALNAGAGGQVPVSQDCMNVMSTTMSVWASSGGALDPGMYSISKAWGFIGGDYRVVPDDELNGLLALKNTGGIRLDETSCSASVPAGTEVSFGAVGKGYTAQAVCDLLEELGVQSAVLSLGGNVQTLGETKPDGSLWQIAVTDPYDTGAYAGILSVGETAAVTSGGYQRFFEQDGVTYIHILDPATGRPVDNDLLSVTVVTEDGTLADALSTALFVMGEDGAVAYYREHGGFELVLITKDDRVLVTSGLRDAFEETEPEVFDYEYLDG